MQCPQTRLEDTISVLERTLANTQSSTGNSLRPVLSRQISSRRAELNSTRSSVIVHTSTPNLSPNSSEHPTFFAIEDLTISAQQEPPFKIYQDPPGSVPPSRPPIVIVNTPSTAFTDKENQFPFSRMADEDPAKAYEDKMKGLVVKLISLLDIYDPDLYPVDVLKQNEAKWTQLAQECYQEMLSAMMEADDADWLTEQLKANMLKDKEDSKKLVKNYVIKISKKIATDPTIVSSTPSSGAGVNVNPSSEAAQARRAQVNADIEYERLTSEVKLLSQEVRKVEDWTAVDSQWEIRRDLVLVPPTMYNATTHILS